MRNATPPAKKPPTAQEKMIGKLAPPKKPAKAGFGKPKKVETEAEMLARMKRQNKEAAQRIRDKKKPRDDKANGGSPNLPFPFFYEGTRPGGMPLPSLDYYDDDFGVKSLMKKRKKKKKKSKDD